MTFWHFIYLTVWTASSSRSILLKLPLLPLLVFHFPPHLRHSKLSRIFQETKATWATERHSGYLYFNIKIQHYCGSMNIWPDFFFLISTPLCMWETFLVVSWKIYIFYLLNIIMHYYHKSSCKLLLRTIKQH